MALIECKNCGKPLSDKAPMCPHCGTPQNGDLSNLNQNNMINEGRSNYNNSSDRTPAPGRPKKSNAGIWIFCILSVIIVIVGLLWVSTYVIHEDSYNSYNSYEEDTVVDYNQDPYGAADTIIYEPNTAEVSTQQEGKKPILYSWQYASNGDANLGSVNRQYVGSSDATLLITIGKGYSSRTGNLVALGLLDENLKPFTGYMINHSDIMSYTKNGEGTNAIFWASFDEGAERKFQAIVSQSGQSIGLVDPDECDKFISAIKRSTTCTITIPLTSGNVKFDFLCEGLKWK